MLTVIEIKNDLRKRKEKNSRQSFPSDIQNKRIRIRRKVSKNNWINKVWRVKADEWLNRLRNMSRMEGTGLNKIREASKGFDNRNIHIMKILSCWAMNHQLLTAILRPKSCLCWNKKRKRNKKCVTLLKLRKGSPETNEIVTYRDVWKWVGKTGKEMEHLWVYFLYIVWLLSMLMFCLFKN